MTYHHKPCITDNKKGGVYYGHCLFRFAVAQLFALWRTFTWFLSAEQQVAQTEIKFFLQHKQTPMS